MRVLAAVDKFRGTATAAQVAASIGHACWENGHECIELPIADGGEGTLEVLGGPNRTNRVTNRWHMKPARRDIGGNKHAVGASAKSIQRGLALLL